MAQLPQSPTEKITDVCLYFSPLVSTTVDILFSFFLSLFLALSFFFFPVVGVEERRGVFRWAKGLEIFEIAPPSPRLSLSHTHAPHSPRSHHNRSLCVCVHFDISPSHLCPGPCCSLVLSGLLSLLGLLPIMGTSSFLGPLGCPVGTPPCSSPLNSAISRPCNRHTEALRCSFSNLLVGSPFVIFGIGAPGSRAWRLQRSHLSARSLRTCRWLQKALSGALGGPRDDVRAYGPGSWGAGYGGL